MIGHWVLSAWRSFWADRIFAALCIVSLAAGAAACLLVGAYAHEEFNFERDIPGSEAVVRLQTDVMQADGEQVFAAQFPSGLAPVVGGATPGVSAWTRLGFEFDTVTIGGERYSERVAFADPGVFEVFPLRFIEGEAASALSSPDRIVITARARDRLFGAGPALGRTIEHSSGVSFRVAAVVADLPRASHLHLSTARHLRFELIAPVNSPAFRGGQDYDQRFDRLNSYAYFRAAPGMAAEALAPRLRQVAEAEFARRADDGADQGQQIAFPAVSIRDIHLAPARSNDLAPVGDLKQLMLFGLIAAALLFVAAFNYVSMSLARALRRTREVGLRKVVGASRGQLAQQYLGESIVFTALAVLIGFAAAEISAPWFGEAIGRDLDVSALHNLGFLGWAAGAAVLLGLIVGAYPALYLSSARPVDALQGRSSAGVKAPAIMRVLVGVQFAAAVALLSAVFIVGAQVRYVAERPLGFETGDRIILYGTRRDPAGTAARMETFRQIVTLDPSVIAASGAEQMPDWEADTMADLTPAGRAGDPVRSLALRVDFDYPRTLEMSLLAGRWFDPDYGGDRAFLNQPGAQPELVSAIVTRSALRSLGADSPQAAIGRTAQLDAGRGPMTIEVVGVVADLHYRSLRSPMLPTVLLPDATATNGYIVHHRPGQGEAAAAAVQRAWAQAFPEQLLSSDVLGAQMAQMYEADARLMRLIVGCAVATVLVASLGLYGLAGFAARSRTREIGLRKAMGATSVNVLQLMLARFLIPVAIGCLVGWPLAVVLTRDWLEDFAYRAPMTPIPFAFAALIAVVIAFLAVFATTVAAATTRPSVALRVD